MSMAKLTAQPSKELYMAKAKTLTMIMMMTTRKGQNDLATAVEKK